MLHRITCSFVTAASLLLLAVAPSPAGFQGKDVVCWLGKGDWQLRADDKGPYLVECRLPKERPLARDKRHRWHVNAPTIKSENGLFLAYSLEGEPSVYLTKEAGKHARWLFQPEYQLEVRETGRGKERYKEGLEGFTFRVMAAEGTYRDWYLAVEDEQRKAKEPPRKRLKLVRVKKEAACFTYVRTSWWEGHK